MTLTTGAGVSLSKNPASVVSRAGMSRSVRFVRVCGNTGTVVALPR